MDESLKTKGKRPNRSPEKLAALRKDAEMSFGFDDEVENGNASENELIDIVPAPEPKKKGRTSRPTTPSLKEIKEDPIKEVESPKKPVAQTPKKVEGADEENEQEEEKTTTSSRRRGRPPKRLVRRMKFLCKHREMVYFNLIILSQAYP